MFPRPRTECASVEHVIGHPGTDRVAHEFRAQVDAVRQPVRLDGGARLDARREHLLEIDRVRRAVVDDAPLRMADRAHRRDGAPPRACASSAGRATAAAPRGPTPAPSRAPRARRRAGRACRRRGCRTRCRAGRGTAQAARSRRRSPRPGGGGRPHRGPARRARCACGRRSRCTRNRGRAPPRAISSTDALPSDHVVCTCRSPRISASSTSAGGSPSKGCSRSSGGTYVRPSARYSACSSGASGSAPSASTYAALPVARSSSVPKRPGAATTSSTGTPSTVTPSARGPSRSTSATISGSERKRSTTASGSLRRDDDREALGRVAPAARVARRLAAERLGDRAHELP